MIDDSEVAVSVPVGCNVVKTLGADKAWLRHEASGLEFQAELRGRHKTTFIHAALDDMSETVYYVHQLSAAFHHNAWQFAERCKLVEDGDEMDSYWYLVPDEAMMDELLSMPA